MLLVLGTDIRKEITVSKWRQISLAICASAENSGEYLMNSSSTRERFQRERISSWRSWTSACNTFSLSQSHWTSPSPADLPFLPPCATKTKADLRQQSHSRQWWQNLTCFHQWACKIVNHRLIHSKVFGTFLFQSYLPRGSDNTLSIGVTLKDLCEFAQKVNAHFNCIKFLFAFCSRNGGGDEKCRQGSSQATNH